MALNHEGVGFKERGLVMLEAVIWKMLEKQIEQLVKDSFVKLSETKEKMTELDVLQRENDLKRKEIQDSKAQSVDVIQMKDWDRPAVGDLMKIKFSDTTKFCEVESIKGDVFILSFGKGPVEYERNEFEIIHIYKLYVPMG